MKKYDYAVYIGRFQPFHNGHLSVALKGLEIAEKLIVLVGSSDQPRTSKNPWTFGERTRMIRNSIPIGSTVFMEPLLDYPYDDARWTEGVRKNVRRITGPSAKIALIGHDKDGAGYWLKMFPEWDFVDVGYVDAMSATDIRGYFFSFWVRNDYVPKVTARQMQADYEKSDWYNDLRREWLHVTEYKQSWAGSPFPPTFNVVDAVVTFGDHVLLVKRKNAPGRGLWALPGGFIEQREWIVEAALRELREETGLELPTNNLPLAGQFVFDHPDRSPRGRFISHTYYFDLGMISPALKETPTVTAGDDAEVVQWVHLADLRREHLFADHWHILEEALGIEKFQREYHQQKGVAA